GRQREAVRDTGTAITMCSSEQVLAQRLMRRVVMIERAAGRILGGLCAIMLAGVTVDVARAGETAGIPPELVAEYIHAIIQADRNIYYTHVVARLHDLEVPVC